MPQRQTNARKKSDIGSNIRASIRLVYGASPRLFLGVSILKLAMALLSVLGLVLTSSLMGNVVSLVHTATDKEAAFRKILFLLGGITALSTTGQILALITEYMQDLFQRTVSHHVGHLLAVKTVSMDLSTFEDPQALNQRQRAFTDAASRPAAIAERLMEIISSLTTILAMAGGFLLWQPWLLLLIVIAPIIKLKVGVVLAKEKLEHRAAKVETERRGQYFRSIIGEAGTAAEVRVFGLGDFLLQRMQVIWTELFSQEKKLIYRRLIPNCVVAAVTSVDRPLFYAYFIWNLLQGSITFAQFTFYTQGVNILQSRFNALTTALSQLHEHHLFVATLFDYLAIAPVVEVSRPASSQSSISAHPHIEFRDVSFQYPGTDRLVLDRVNFEIKPGEIVALAGRNGSGKTTLVKLLAGLYEPTSGQILFDGVDLTTVDRDKLRSYISIVLQHFKVYQLSIADNVGIGDVKRVLDRDAIREASEQAGLDELVANLPEGYDTTLGRQLYKGLEFSGGRKQLVALARALMRDAPLLVMDEPTSALDVHNERRFLRLLLRKKNNARRSILLITHRMTAVRQAERILLIHEGRIVEQGSHEDLFAQGGHYAELYKAQVEMYGKAWLEDDPVVS